MKHQSSITEAQIEPEVTLGSLVREALDFVDGNVEKAAERIYYKVMSDKLLLKQVIKSAISYSVREKSNHLNRDTRKNLVLSVERHQSRMATLTPSERVVALAQTISACLLDMPLGGGRKLRDATSVELREQIERYEKSATSMAHKARWLSLILQSTPDGRHVGDVITEERARELFDASRNEVAA